MRKAIVACIIALIPVIPAEANDYSPAQLIVITMETWRLRAVDCRTRYNSFTGPEVTAITDFVINGAQVAKFDSTDLTDLMKAIGVSVSLTPPLTREVCGQLHTLVFGLP